MDIPLYIATGFLESGKTSFFNEIINSGDFLDGLKTLLIVCEEGEVSYDEVHLAGEHVDIVTVEDEEELTSDFLERCQSFYKPARVFLEYNGMWDMDHLLDLDLPQNWMVYQIINTINGATFETYLKNMRSIIGNMIGCAETIIFNRCNLSMDLQMYRRSVKALNRQAEVIFEDEDGRILELGKDQPPYDLNADVIKIEDDDFGLWYIDAMENPERYDGKIVEFVGKVMLAPQFPEGIFVPGRNAMTCCADDIRFIGYACKTAHIKMLQQKQWIRVIAKVKYEYFPPYHGKGPVLYARKIASAQEPKDEVVYFN